MRPPVPVLVCRFPFIQTACPRALAGSIKRPYRCSFVVGNLAREEARTFFFDYIAPFQTLPPGATEAWERVYEVCGGNP